MVRIREGKRIHSPIDFGNNSRSSGGFTNLTCVAISPKPPMRRRPIRTIRQRPKNASGHKPNGFFGVAVTLSVVVVLYCITITLVFVEQILSFRMLSQFAQFAIIFSPILLAFIAGIMFQRAKSLQRKRKKEEQLKQALEQREMAEARVALIMKNADKLRRTKDRNKKLNIAEMFHVDISDACGSGENGDNYISTSEERMEKPLIERGQM